MKAEALSPVRQERVTARKELLHRHSELVRWTFVGQAGCHMYKRAMCVGLVRMICERTPHNMR